MRKTCMEMIFELAKSDPRVVYIGSDVSGHPLSDMKEAMPDRFFMDGIYEGNIIGVAAGMAMDGYVPFLSTIATFITRRCYEQIAIDLCLHDLPVRLIGTGGGLAYAPYGPTHMATEDMGIMGGLPNMTVVAPADAEEMKRFMGATVDHPHPIYIRMGAGGDPIVSREEDRFEIGKAIVLRQPEDVTIVSTGVMVGRALAVAEMLAADGIPCGVVNMHTVKPLDAGTILDLGRRCKLLVTLEEHFRRGGLGSAVTDLLVDHLDGPLPRIKAFALPDAFTDDFGSQDWLLERAGLQPPQVAANIREAIGS
jgi:transketolase